MEPGLGRTTRRLQPGRTQGRRLFHADSQQYKPPRGAGAAPGPPGCSSRRGAAPARGCRDQPDQAGFGGKKGLLVISPPAPVPLGWQRPLVPQPPKRRILLKKAEYLTPLPCPGYFMAKTLQNPPVTPQPQSK